MNVAGPMHGLPAQKLALAKVIVTLAPGPEGGSRSVEGFEPPVLIDPPGSTNPLTVVPFGALTCVVDVVMLPPGIVFTELVMFVPPDPADVLTSIFTDL